jgi:hypothetical protein
MTNQTETTMPLDTEASKTDATNASLVLEEALIASDTVREKLGDAQTPGYQAEFDPAEAEAAGAFSEEALSEADALASTHDYPHFVFLSSPLRT